MSARRSTRSLATGLLVVMAVVYVGARTGEAHYPALAWVRAFAEAAMVGALADWFAVVALFRHPLGLPIPHTAVIPRRKKQIGDNLAAFIQENFLTAENIAARLRRADLVRRTADWLSGEANAATIARKLTAAAPRLLEALDEDGMRRFLRDQVVLQIRRIPLAPLAGRLLGILSENGRDQELLDQALRVVRLAVGENKPLITAKIAEELAVVPDFPGVTELKGALCRSLAGRIVEKVQGTLDDILADPDHVVRSQFDARLAAFVAELGASPELAARAEQLKESFLGNATLTGSLEALWSAVRHEIVTDLADADSRIHRQLTGVIRQVGVAVAADAAFQQRLDAWMLHTLRSLIEAHGHEVGALIRETVDRWDGREVAEKIESQVGSDLQFIRINGTLVGGLVGLTLHALGVLFW